VSDLYALVWNGRRWRMASFTTNEIRSNCVMPSQGYWLHRYSDPMCTNHIWQRMRPESKCQILDRSIFSCPLGSIANFLDKHLRLAQVWRMSRIAPFDLCFGARCKHFLKCRRSRLIVLADKIGGRDEMPSSSTFELNSLHLIRLRYKS